MKPRHVDAYVTESDIARTMENIQLEMMNGQASTANKRLMCVLELEQAMIAFGRAERNARMAVDKATAVQREIY